MANALDAGVPTLADLMDKRVRLHQPHQAAHAATCQAESQLQPLMSGLHMLHQPVMIIFIFVIVIISIITNSISIGISTFIIVFAFGFYSWCLRVDAPVRTGGRRSADPSCPR